MHSCGLTVFESDEFLFEWSRGLHFSEGGRDALAKCPNIAKVGRDAFGTFCGIALSNGFPL